MFHFSVHLASTYKTLLMPLRFVGGCSLLGLAAWSLIGAVYSIVSQARKMHQIPCTKCRFFTGDYRLKCTVKPQIANTEQAISCSDYRSKY